MNNTDIDVKHNRDFLTDIAFHLPETIMCILFFCMFARCMCYCNSKWICKKSSRLPHTRTFSSFEVLEAQIVVVESKKSNNSGGSGGGISDGGVAVDVDEENIPVAHEVYHTAALPCVVPED